MFVNIAFKCGKCEESFETGKQLQLHLRIHRRMASHFPTPESAPASAPVKKVEEIIPKKPKSQITPKPIPQRIQYECYMCKYKFKGLPFMRKHMKLHINGQRFQFHFCSICRIRLNQTKMNSHVCGQKDSVQCEYCSKQFTATIKLLNHLEKMHETNRRLYQCGKCTKYLPMIFLRDSHQNTHVDEPEKYSKSSVHKKMLNVEKSKDHLCEECGKTFSSGG